MACPPGQGSGIPQRSLRQPGNRPSGIRPPQQQNSGIRPPNMCSQQQNSGMRPSNSYPQQQNSGIRPPNVCGQQQQPSGIRPPNSYPQQQQQSSGRPPNICSQQQNSGMRPPQQQRPSNVCPQQQQRPQNNCPSQQQRPSNNCPPQQQRPSSNCPPRQQSGGRPPNPCPSQQMSNPCPPQQQSARQTVCPRKPPSIKPSTCPPEKPPSKKCSDPNTSTTCRTEVDPVTGQKKIIKTTTTIKKGPSPCGKCGVEDGPEEPKAPQVLPPSEVSKVYKDNFEDLMSKANADPSKKIRTISNKMSDVCPPMVMTPCGQQQAVQQMIMEHRVERGLTGERVSKHITGIDVDECTGKAKQVEINLQNLDPKNRLRTGDLKEIISTTSTVSVTPSHTQATKYVLREIQSIDLGLGLNQEQVLQLVEEETEDVENTMKILPPDLLESTPERYTLKRRLQNLRLNSESIALLEQSVVQPHVTADEEQAETPPEILATIMYSVEKGVSPKKPPNQIFNALFSDSKDKDYMIVSSVAPGILQDVVVPSDVAADIFKEAMDHSMEESITLVTSTTDKPKDSSFVEMKPTEPKPPARHTSTREPRSIEDETPPWTPEDFQSMKEITGVVPIDTLAALDLNGMAAAELMECMTDGIEYFIDAPSTEYMSRVQLRGSVPPSWFPGYMVALPQIADVVRVSKSPSEVMLDAWRSVQPKIFAEDSIATVDF